MKNTKLLLLAALATLGLASCGGIELASSEKSSESKPSTTSQQTTPSSESTGGDSSESEPSSQEPTPSSQEVDTGSGPIIIDESGDSSEPATSDTSTSQDPPATHTHNYQKIGSENEYDIYRCAEDGDTYYAQPFAADVSALGSVQSDGTVKLTKGISVEWTFTLSKAMKVSFAPETRMSNSSHSSRSFFCNPDGADSSDSYESNEENRGKQRLQLKLNGENLPITNRLTWGEAGLDSNALNPIVMAEFDAVEGKNVITLIQDAQAGYRLLYGGNVRLYVNDEGGEEPPVVGFTVNVNGVAVNVADIKPEGSTDLAQYKLELKKDDALVIMEGSNALGFYHWDDESNEAVKDGETYTAPRDGEYTIYINENKYVYVTAPAEPVDPQNVITGTKNGDALTLVDVKPEGSTDLAQYKIDLVKDDVVAFKLGDEALGFYHWDNEANEAVKDGETYTAPWEGEYIFYVNSSKQIYIGVPAEPVPPHEHDLKQTTTVTNSEGKDVTLYECSCGLKEITIDFTAGTYYKNDTAQASVATKMDKGTRVEWKIKVNKAIEGKIFFEGSAGSNNGRYFFNQNKEVNPVNPVTGAEYPDQPSSNPDGATEDAWRYMYGVNDDTKIAPALGGTFAESGAGVSPMCFGSISLASGENTIKLYQMNAGYRLTFSGKVHIQFTEEEATLVDHVVDGAALIAEGANLKVPMVINENATEGVKEYMLIGIALNPELAYSIQVGENGNRYTLGGANLKSAVTDAANVEGAIKVNAAGKYNIYVDVTDLTPENVGERIWIEKLNLPDPVSFNWADALQDGSSALESDGKFVKNATYTLKVTVATAGHVILKATLKGSAGNGGRKLNEDGQVFGVTCNGEAGTIVNAGKTYDEIFNNDQTKFVEIDFAEFDVIEGENTIVITTTNAGYRLSLDVNSPLSLNY